MRRPIFVSTLAALGLGSVGCDRPDAIAKADPGPPAPAPVQADGDQFPPGPYADRDVALARRLINGGALLLDVRSASEFAGGRIDGAVNIPHTQIGERIADIRELQGDDPHKPIVVYCRSGRRSALAKRELEAAGFDRITNLGGIDDWPD